MKHFKLIVDTYYRNGQHVSCHTTTILVEITYLFMYRSDLDYKYEISRSNSEYMFKRKAIFYPTTNI